jgi:hypothetical protein
MWDDVAGLPPFRRDQAPDWLTEARIRRAVRAGDLVVGRRGVLLGRRRIDDARSEHALATEIAIAGTRGSPTYACLGSAGVLHGVSRLGQPPRRVRLYRERGGPWRDEAIAVLVCALPPEHITVTRGVPTTTLPRTAVDLGRWVSPQSGVVVMDSTRRLGCSREELEAVLDRCRRWPGVRKARAVAEFADPRAASPLESISRFAMRAADLPRPEPQVALGIDRHGYPVGIVDFYWEEFGVVGEADGLIKYDDEERLSLRAEKLRQEALEALGFIVVRWTWDDIWRRPDWVMMRLRRAMAAGARRRSA